MPTQIVVAAGQSAVRRASHLGLTGRFTVVAKTSGEALVEVSNTPTAVESPGGATWIAWDAGTVTSDTVRVVQGPVYALRLTSATGGATFEFMESQIEPAGSLLSASLFGSSLDVLYADLPLPGASNIHQVRYCVDRGAYFESNGLAWVQKTPGVAAFEAEFSLWEDRGTPAEGARKRFTDIGNQSPEFVYLGGKWKTCGGEVLAYSLPAALTSTSGTTTTLTLPAFNLPAGMLGARGRVRISGAAQTVGATAITAKNLAMDLDGLSIKADTSNATHKRIIWRVDIHNQTAASQVIYQRAGSELGYETSTATDWQTGTKNTDSSDRPINGTMAFTAATAITAQLADYRVFLEI